MIWQGLYLEECGDLMKAENIDTGVLQNFNRAEWEALELELKTRNDWDKVPSFADYWGIQKE